MASITDSQPTLKVEDLANHLGVSKRTMHAYLRDDPRVIKLGPRGRRGKRDHVSLRIEPKVAEEIIKEWKRG